MTMANGLPNNTAPPIMTKHARQRMDEMHVTLNDVYHALRDPEMDYRAPRKHGETARLACRGDIAVAYKPDERQPDRMVVMTVLWNRKVFKRPEHPGYTGKVEDV